MATVAEPTKPFEILAGHPALDFINTLDDRYTPGGPRELLTSYARFLEFCEQAGVLTKEETRNLRRVVPDDQGSDTVRRAVELREALFALVESSLAQTTPPSRAIESLNHVLHEAESARAVIWDKTHFTWQADDARLSTLTPLWRLADGAAQLLTSSDAAHIRECGSATCRWFFLDRSRNHTRRWCDMKMCGNRNKARRFHTRRASAQADGG
jgi:predicted RNA-binding Zn ribbon-like protein